MRVPPNYPISPNIEDRRFTPEEDKLAMAMNAARTGDYNPEIGVDLPPWMWPDDTQLQQAALDKLAFQRAFNLR